MATKKKGKGISSLQWYKQVYRFLLQDVCYSTTPITDKSILDELIKFARKNSCSIFRVNTEYRKYGLYISRGNRGNSILIGESDLERFCSNNGFGMEDLVNSNQAVPYSASDFKSIRHTKNVVNKQNKINNEIRRYNKNIGVINNPLSTEEQKKTARLDVWAEQKLKNKEVSSTEYENILFCKLSAKYKRRVKRQQKIIVNNKVYFIDIYMKAYKVAIEVDGGYHNEDSQIVKDKQKDCDLSSLGLMVIRIKNDDVRDCFDRLKVLLDQRHKSIINGITVPTGTVRI